jgi:hypothetical protein
MKDEALKLALDDLILEYHMETSSFAKRVNEIFKQALAAPVQPVPWSQALESVWAEPDDTPPAARPTVQGPLSFNCSAGCGACGVKLQDFVTRQTQAQEGDEWVVVDTQPKIVSSCCGSPVEVWDERKQDITASVDATPPAAQRQWVGLTQKQKAEIAEDWAVDVLPDIDHVVACIEAKLKEKNT